MSGGFTVVGLDPRRRVRIYPHPDGIGNPLSCAHPIWSAERGVEFVCLFVCLSVLVLQSAMALTVKRMPSLVKGIKIGIWLRGGVRVYIMIWSICCSDRYKSSNASGQAMQRERERERDQTDTSRKR